MRMPLVAASLVVAALVFVVSATDARAQNRNPGSPCDLPHAVGVSSQQLTSGQRPRTYRLFVPPGYDGHTRLPLVLDLHGSGGSSAGQAKTSGLESLSVSERFIVATLDAEGARWNVPVQDGRADDVAYVGDVITHVATRRVRRRCAGLCDRVLGWRTDDVAAWVSTRLAPRSHRAGVRASIPRAV